jgi:hypothetical protein
VLQVVYPPELYEDARLEKYKNIKFYDKYLHTFQEKILMKSKNKILLGKVLFYFLKKERN